MDRRQLLKIQRNEITEYHIYSRLAQRIDDPHNQHILRTIAADERRHYGMLKTVSRQDVTPRTLTIHWYLFFSAVFGLTFSLKLMERGEELAVALYRKSTAPPFKRMLIDEQRHEKQLLAMLKEERIAYASSIVLGLNDALVELTAALAGLTLALGNGPLIALIGLITGIAASLSMGSSEYLSSREEAKKEKHPAKAAVYTATAYFITVLLLIAPYFFLQDVFLALPVMIGTAIVIIAFYTFYISVAKNLPFRTKFLEMVAISLSVAGISFAIGWMIRIYIGVGA